MVPVPDQVGMGEIQYTKEYTDKLNEVSGALQVVTDSLNERASTDLGKPGNYRLTGFLREENGGIMHPIFTTPEKKYHYVAGGKDLRDVYPLSGSGSQFSVEWGGDTGLRLYDRATVFNRRDKSTPGAGFTEMQHGVFWVDFVERPDEKVNIQFRLTELFRSGGSSPTPADFDMIGNGMKKAAGWEKLPAPVSAPLSVQDQKNT